MKMTKLAPLMLSAALIGSCSSDEKSVAVGSIAPDAKPASEVSAPDVNWTKYGLDNAEARYSTLSDINDSNVSRLSLAWAFDYPTNRGMESTPLERDGVIYSTSSWSMVYAHDALTGKLLWIPRCPVNGPCMPAAMWSIAE